MAAAERRLKAALAGTVEYYDALKAYHDAQLALAQAQLELLKARAEAGVGKHRLLLGESGDSGPEKRCKHESQHLVDIEVEKRQAT